MNEWKGPWKCKECGNVFHGIVLETAKKERWHFTTFSGPHKECTGELMPYDRRDPSQAVYGQEQFHAGAEAAIKKIENRIWENECSHDDACPEWRYTGRALQQIKKDCIALLAEQEKK